MPDLVVSAYFTTKEDPQRRGRRYPADHWPLIKKWYEGLLRCGLRGLVLHDGCSEKFVRMYSNDHLAFHKVELGNYTTNVERFFHYLDLFDSGAVEIARDQYTLFTDLFDITFFNDPFKFMRARGKNMYFGVFEQFSPNLRERWNKEAYRDPKLLLDKPYLAATAFGGRNTTLHAFLENMIVDFLGINPKYNVDMAVLHKTAWTCLNAADMFYGAPFTGNLKTGAYTSNSCIVHLRSNREDHGVKK